MLKRLARILLTLGPRALAWLCLVVCWLATLGRRSGYRWQNGIIWFEVPFLWAVAIAIGPGVVLVKRLDYLDHEPLRLHEEHHDEQAEAAAFAALVLGSHLTVAGATWWVALIAWCASWWTLALAANSVAWLRGEPSYRGSVLEEGARGVSEE